MTVPRNRDSKGGGVQTTSRRRVVVKVVVCVLVLAVCLFLALAIGDGDYHATAIGWMPLLAAIALIALAYAYVVVARRSLRFVEAAQLACCERGQKLPFSITFENAGPLILLNVRVELFVANGEGDVAQSTVTVLTLGPRSTHEIPFDVPFEHVGLFAAGLRSVTITDFLGLFEKTIVSDKTSYICVTPRVPRLGAHEFSDDSEMESMRTLKTALADSLDYAYVRDYEPGDPLKTIHWKLSARTDHYLTRLFEKSTLPAVMVFVDLYAKAPDIDEAMTLRDSAMESALSVADFARSKDLDTQVCYVNTRGEARHLASWDESAIVEMVRELPRNPSDAELRRQSLDEIRAIASDATAPNNLIVCSANVEEDMVGTIVTAGQLRKSPFLVASVPHRLVDRDLERHIVRLGALDGHHIGYQVIGAAAELEGGEL